MTYKSFLYNSRFLFANYLITRYLKDICLIFDQHYLIMKFVTNIFLMFMMRYWKAMGVVAVVVERVSCWDLLVGDLI